MKTLWTAVGLTLLLTSVGAPAQERNCWQKLVERCTQAYWQCAQGPSPERFDRALERAPARWREALARLRARPHTTVNPFFFAPAHRQALSEWRSGWRRYYNINALIVYSEAVKPESVSTGEAARLAARERMVRELLDVEIPGWEESDTDLLFFVERGGATLYVPGHRLPLRFPAGSYVILADYLAVGVVMFSPDGLPHYISYSP